jgi:DNA primase large subunit
MVSLQEQRIETQERITQEVQGLLEMRRQEQQSNIKDVYNRINTVNKELTDKIEDVESKILDELKKIREDLTKKDEGISSRIGNIETWKYGIVLVAIVLAWIAGQANLLDNLFK